jgi:hypothetical protein
MHPSSPIIGCLCLAHVFVNVRSCADGRDAGAGVCEHLPHARPGGKRSYVFILQMPQKLLHIPTL